MQGPCPDHCPAQPPRPLQSWASSLPCPPLVTLFLLAPVTCCCHSPIYLNSVLCLPPTGSPSWVWTAEQLDPRCAVRFPPHVWVRSCPCMPCSVFPSSCTYPPHILLVWCPLPTALEAPGPHYMAPGKRGSFLESAISSSAMTLSTASQGTKTGSKREARTPFPAASGHHQSSPEPVSAARSYAGRDTGHTAFCAVACRTVWPWEDTSLSQSRFLICILWRMTGPALQGFL